MPIVNFKDFYKRFVIHGNKYVRTTSQAVLTSPKTGIYTTTVEIPQKDENQIPVLKNNMNEPYNHS